MNKQCQLDFLLEKVPVLILTLFLLSTLGIVSTVIYNFSSIDISAKECENIAGIMNVMAASGNSSVAYSISMPGHIAVGNGSVTFNGIRRQLLCDAAASEFDASETVYISRDDGRIYLSGDI
jgi:hypothetical protein